MINLIGAGFLSRFFIANRFSFFVLIWKLFNYIWLAGKNLDGKPVSIEVIMQTGF